jgi:ABC-type polysaccharide/polyol phosphate transport system ATPase subunit
MLSRRFRRDLNAQPFYALNDISFTVRHGETVGIIGRNGSGKTTLLRVLSGIIRPTNGRVSVRGQFACLIGLGAGFLPELSGRKNIYLNAAIFGSPPEQVDTIIDEIIAFSSLESFVDSPVKHYSSGMIARLAFSIAIHIVPDMIFLDEVFAVGDAAFQQKCMDKLQTFKSEGRTLLFVSHSAEALTMMCERTIWLHEGRLRMDAQTDEVLKQYAQEFYE